MRRQPRHTTQPTCLGQRQTNVWTTSSKTNLTQSTSNSLRRNLLIMRTYCIKGSFGSSEMTIRRIVLSWRRDVTRGRPDRGRSAKCPVSLKRLTRRSIVETLTPKWLATCCCLWSCISNAIALPQSYHDWKKVQSSVKMKRKIGKRIEERCVSLKCTKWCEEILCWRFKHACFARNFGFPYCPCNALCSARLNDFTHRVDSTSTKDSYTCGSHSQDNL